MTKVGKVFLLLLAATSLSNAGWEEELIEEIARLPLRIADVKSTGHWNEDGKEGYYRIIVGRTGSEHPRAMLTVQWIAFGDDMSGPKLEASVLIKELTTPTIYTFKLPEYSEGDTEDVLIFDAVHSYELSKYPSKVRLVGIGKYVFEGKLR